MYIHGTGVKGYRSQRFVQACLFINTLSADACRTVWFSQSRDTFIRSSANQILHQLTFQPITALHFRTVLLVFGIVWWSISLLLCRCDHTTLHHTSCSSKHFITPPTDQNTSSHLQSKHFITPPTNQNTSSHL